MKWTPRIVLSILLAAFLLVPLAVGTGYALGDAAPPTDDGIGTSPSRADDVQENAQPYTPAPELVCGIWVDSTPDAADARSLAGEPPDVLVFPSARTGCYDAVGIASVRWPEHSFVRAVVFQGYRAREAAPPHAALELPAAAEWRVAALQRSLPTPMQAGFPILAILEILSPLISTVIAKVFATKVKDVSRRSEIAGYADTAFHVVEALGKQYGWTGAEKYNRFIQQVIDSVKASGGPELTGPEMAQLQGLATTKALMAKVHAALPPSRPLPLPPPPRG